MSCNDFKRHLDSARDLYSKGKISDAERELNEVLRLKPDYADAHYNLGNLLYEQDKYDDAEKEFRKAIELKPDYPAAHNNLCILLSERKKYGEAEREYRDAIKLRPDDPDAHNNMGVLLKELKRHDEAEKEYRDAIRLKPNHVKAHYNLGNLLYDQKKHDDAEREYRETIRLKPDYAAAHNNLGVLLKEQKKYEEAERAYQRALQLDKNKWQAMWGLSEVHVEMARPTRDMDVFGDALTEINDALRITNKNPGIIDNEDFLDMYLLRGYIHTALKDYKEAKWDYGECKKYDENNLKVHRNLRKINKILGERASLRWMRIPLLAVSGTGLIATCIAYLWFEKFDDIQFYAFASTTFAFIILGILLPMIRRVKVGTMEMEFEPGKAGITTASVAVEK